MSAATADPSSSNLMQQVEIEFLYIDLDVCTRCRETHANLDAALAVIGDVLRSAGVEVVVRKTLVTSAAQAAALGFVSSPTIRVNGMDIALELRESSCASCAAACGGGATDCRVWLWQGEEYTAAPVPMIVDAILRAVYGGQARPRAEAVALSAAPDNLARFFASKAPPAAEAARCGTSSACSCGCRAEESSPHD